MTNMIRRSIALAVAVLICLCMPSYAAQGLTVTDDLGDFCFFKSIIFDFDFFNLLR